MGKTSCVTMTHQGCFEHRVRFHSCVFLSSEVSVVKGIFGDPALILACHESCREVEGGCILCD